MVAGYCVTCGKNVSNKASHIASVSFRDHEVVPRWECGPGKPHQYVLKTYHLPKTSVQGVHHGFPQISFAVGHISMLFCTGCGDIAHREYAVYTHGPLGELQDIHVCPNPPPASTTGVNITEVE